VAYFEFLMASLLVDGVILSVAVLQAERRISRYDTVCDGRSLGPLVKRGLFGITPCEIQCSNWATTQGLDDDLEFGNVACENSRFPRLTFFYRVYNSP